MIRPGSESEYDEEKKQNIFLLLIIKALDTGHGNWGFTASATSTRA